MKKKGQLWTALTGLALGASIAWADWQSEGNNILSAWSSYAEGECYGLGEFYGGCMHLWWGNAADYADSQASDYENQLMMNDCPEHKQNPTPECASLEMWWSAWNYVAGQSALTASMYSS